MNDYMEILVRETITLHKVLTRYLAIPTLEVSQLFGGAQPRSSNWIALVCYDTSTGSDQCPSLGGVWEDRHSQSGG